MTLPTDSQERKDTPIARGFLDYFPDACAAVARVSKLGNDKHNPGEEMHHARGKSTDHADCIVRHLMDRGTIDEEDGTRHSAKVAWRALALLQEELEAAGEADLARGARLPDEGPVAPNNIHQRIAGDTVAARRIKNLYYGGTEFMPGTPVALKGSKYVGTVVSAEEYESETGLELPEGVIPARWDSLRNAAAFLDFDDPEQLEIR